MRHLMAVLALSLLTPALSHSAALEIGMSPIAGINVELGRLSLTGGADVEVYSNEAPVYYIDPETEMLVMDFVEQKYFVFKPVIKARFHLSDPSGPQPYLSIGTSKGIPSGVEGFTSIAGPEYEDSLDDYSMTLHFGVRHALVEGLRIGGEAGISHTWMTAGDLEGTLLEGDFNIFLQWKP